jgi:hypothetical protein
VAFAGIGLNLLGLPAWEGWMAALISCFVVWIGVSLGYQAVQELLDRSVGPELIGKLEQSLWRIDGVVDSHELRARRMGGDVLVDLHVSHGHQIAEQVRSQLLAADPAVTEVLVHIDPEADDKYDTPQVQDVDDPENLVRTLAAGVEGVQSVSHVLCHFIRGRLDCGCWKPPRLPARCARRWRGRRISIKSMSTWNWMIHTMFENPVGPGG